jgi:hypothetical protein
VARSTSAPAAEIFSAETSERARPRRDRNRRSIGSKDRPAPTPCPPARESGEAEARPDSWRAPARGLARLRRWRCRVVARSRVKGRVPWRVGIATTAVGPWHGASSAFAETRARDVALRGSAGRRTRPEREIGAPCLRVDKAERRGYGEGRRAGAVWSS